MAFDVGVMDEKVLERRGVLGKTCFFPDSISI